MPTLLMLFAALIMTGVGQDAARPSFPKKSGVFAMTAGGPVELKVNGEPTRVERSTTFRCFYSPGDYDKIPAVESLQSFYVSTMGWAPRGVYLIAGRELLSNPSERYKRLIARSVTKGAVAFQVVAEELESPARLEQVARELSTDPDAEIDVVLDLVSTANMNDRMYPVRLARPKK